ncbi:MAG: EVE domain-containing protein, partial [Pseudomonas sp.]|nr:EVE domain-containing protein [Pseudomonas sp.]
RTHVARVLSKGYAEPVRPHVHDLLRQPLDVEFVEAFDEVLPLQQLKNNPLLAELALVQRGSRLSVMPVSDDQWAAILAMR